MLKVMAHADKRLELVWVREKQKPARSHLDKWSGHGCPAPRSLPFLPDLHSELKRLWSRQYSALLHLFQHADYANVEGLTKHG